ncbi:MAG: trypsin-like peptidase domain-containing protein [Planctomycetota bacterium]
MILHTCPHCKASAFYAAELEGAVHCHSCGGAFELSAFTKTDKAASVRLIRGLPVFAQRITRSRVFQNGGLSAAGAFAAWLLLSWIGVIPDNLRIVNRRTIDVDEWETVLQAVGLVTGGVPKPGGGIVFAAAETGFLVSNDGFVLTSAKLEPVLEFADLPAMLGEGHDLADNPGLARPSLERLLFYEFVFRNHALYGLGDPLRTWVFLNGQRYEAEVVLADDVAGFAVLKLEGKFPYRFELEDNLDEELLNREVRAVGLQANPRDLRTGPVTAATVATTKGTVSRKFKDDSGTHWMEHTAAITPYSRGGPLLTGSTAIAINAGGQPGIYRAISIAPHANRIDKAIREWREKHKKG